MKSVTKNMFIRASPGKVFETLDDLGVTGMHMTKSSAMMMGSKLKLEYLTANHTGLASKYRWTGRMLGMKMDFTVEVTRWIKGVEKIWETIGETRMIIYSWYRMRLMVKPESNANSVKLSIIYKRPKGWFAKLLSYLLADWYCKWCLKNMLEDTKSKLSLGEL